VTSPSTLQPTSVPATPPPASETSSTGLAGAPFAGAAGAGGRESAASSTLGTVGRPTTLESLSEQLAHAPGINAVSIISGRRAFTYGAPEGPARAEWSIGSGTTVRVWGDESPLFDAMLELARLVDMREHEIDDLAEALVQANDRQLRLFELSRLSVETLDRSNTIERTLRHAAELTDSEDAVLVDASGSATWLGLSERRAPRWLIDATGKAVQGGTLRRTLIAGERRALLAPVVVGQDRYVLAVGRPNGLAFGTPERKIIDALAASLASSLQLVSMHESALQRAIIDNEHATAAALAAAVLPKGVPVVPGIDVAAATIPARAVGGDYFTSVACGDTLRFAVGDVSGKGLPAAVLMTNAITTTNAVFTRTESDCPVELLAGIHEALDALLVGTGRFITMCVGTARALTDGTVEVRLANAGHSPVFVAEASSRHHVPPLAPPVGVGGTPHGEAFRTVLRSTATLLIGSDGLTEQEDVAGRQFGDERLGALASAHLPITSLADAIFAGVRRHGGEQQQFDDQTVFVLRPSAAPVPQGQP
jgi:serine phosphatase RsbU (regulator of sigma subunit)